MALSRITSTTALLQKFHENNKKYKQNNQPTMTYRITDCTMTIEALPTEMIYSIVNYLSFKEMATLAGTSKQFNNLIKSIPAQFNGTVTFKPNRRERWTGEDAAGFTYAGFAQAMYEVNDRKQALEKKYGTRINQLKTDICLDSSAASLITCCYNCDLSGIFGPWVVGLIGGSTTSTTLVTNLPKIVACLPKATVACLGLAAPLQGCLTIAVFGCVTGGIVSAAMARLGFLAQKHCEAGAQKSENELQKIQGKINKVTPLHVTIRPVGMGMNK